MAASSSSRGANPPPPPAPVKYQFPLSEHTQRPPPNEARTWLKLAGTPKGDTPPGPEWWREADKHREFCQYLTIHELGGDAENRFCLWEFNFPDRDAVHKALSCLKWNNNAETEAMKLLSSGEIPRKLKPLKFEILVESEGGLSWTGYYLAKLLRRQPAALAFAIQLLGTP